MCRPPNPAIEEASARNSDAETRGYRTRCSGEPGGHSPLRVGSLFSGCGGLDLGLELAGFEIAWAVESDESCRRVLARHWPGLPLLEDVRHVDDWMPEVDLLAGGFPCQDLSYAGRGIGLDGDRSKLWFVFADAIRLLRPRLVLVENVPGLATRGLGRVLYDLAESGYVGRWLRLRASDLGAPHERERLFILATADAGRLGRREKPRGSSADEGADGGRRANEDHVAGRARPGRVRAAERAATADADRELRRPGRPVPIAERRGRPTSGGSPAGIEWGEFEPAIRRWEGILGRAAPRPVDDRDELSPAFVEWMLGYPDGWTEGEATRRRLKMLGNSVQVQCAELVGQMLLGRDTLPGSGISRPAAAASLSR